MKTKPITEGQKFINFIEKYGLNADKYGRNEYRKHLSTLENQKPLKNRSNGN